MKTKQAVAKKRSTKRAKAAKASSSKAAAPASEVKRKPEPKAEPEPVKPSPVITLVAKPPKDATVRGQGAIILTVLKEAGGKLTTAELVARLEGRITTKNVLGMNDVVHMCLPVLISRGLVVKEAQ